MPTDIGPRIGIDGEREFRNGINNINQQLRTLGAEMKAVTSAFDDNDKSQEALAAQTGVLNRQIDAQQQKLQQLQRGLDAAAQKFGESDTRTLKWAQAVNNATADLNKMRTQLSRVETQMDGTEDATDDLADAMDDVGRASSGLGDMLKSAFLGGGIAGLIQSAVSGMKDLVENTSEYRRIMASLDNSSQRAGYSAGETEATYRQLFSVLGDEQTAATTTANLQALGLAQDELTRLTDAAIGAWATYGDSIPIDSLAEAINETIRVGQVTGTFADALNWAGGNEDEFNAKLAAAGSEAERANLVLQELTDQGLAQAGEAWRQNNQDITQANLATAGLSETMAGFGAILSPMVTQIKTWGSEALQSVLGVAQAFQSGGISGGMEALGELVGSAVDKLRENGPQIIEAGTEIVGDLVEGIAAGLPSLVSEAGELLRGLLDFLAESGPDVIAAGADMLGDLAVGIIQSIPDLVAQLPEIITGFVDFIKESLPQIARSGGEILGKLAAGIIGDIPDLVRNLPQVMYAIANGLKDSLALIVDVGINLVQGLWDGIASMGSWLKDKLLGWAGDILDSITGFFGINSPSTVLRDMVGRNMAKGVGVGFIDEMKGVSSRMQQALPTLTAEDINNASAGVVNGLSASSAGQSFPSTIVLQLENGMEIARWQLPYLRAAERANPEVLSGV